MKQWATYALAGRSGRIFQLSHFGLFGQLHPLHREPTAEQRATTSASGRQEPAFGDGCCVGGGRVTNESTKQISKRHVGAPELAVEPLWYQRSVADSPHPVFGPTMQLWNLLSQTNEWGQGVILAVLTAGLETKAGYRGE
jgi:hypothetical protein